MDSPAASPLPLGYPDEPVPGLAAPVKRELDADDTMADAPLAKRARSAASDADDKPLAAAPAADPVQPRPIPVIPPQDPPPPPYTGPTQMTAAQHRFCVSTVRILKRLKDAAAFLRPVDPIALGIPHYPLIIKRPMDFGTVETRLHNSSPAKPPVEPDAARYRTTDDFVADVRQIFENCYLFNGPEHFISSQARKIEDVLDKQLKQMPPDEEPAARHESPPQPKKAAAPARRQSTSVPTVRRNTPDEVPAVVRPKREIHPPAPKDLPYTDVALNGKRPRKGKSRGAERDDGTVEQLRYCGKILAEFNKKSLVQIAGPFYEPVDAQYVPTYYNVIKRPMDLATMRKKLDEGEYPNAHAFHNDFRLMMKNCVAFNPPGTAVHSAGLEMDRIFKEKWKNLPPLRQLTPEDEDDAEDSEDDDDAAIVMIEAQIEAMKNNLALLKAKKKNNKPKAAAPPPKEKKSPVAHAKKPARKASTSSYTQAYAPPVPGPSKAKATPPPKPAKNGPPKKSRGGASSDTERDMSTMSFEQKKELSTTIESLEGDKLERVIQIIYEGMPDLKNSNEEIELDIESLTPAVLTKLWNFVVKPQQQKKLAAIPSGPKRTSGNASKGTAATGGVKRKSMDEAVESERIRRLEAQISQFGKAPGAGTMVNNTNLDDDARSSGASGSESDSGSDSD